MFRGSEPVYAPLDAIDEVTAGGSVVIVRTMSGAALGKTALTAPARKTIGDFESVLRFAEAGVEVLRCRVKKDRRALRDKARRALKKEKAIRFAGRVISDESKQPVIYTENLFVKFEDSVKKTTYRRILKQHGVEVKRQVEYARNAFFVGAPEGCGRKVFTIASKLLRENEVELCRTDRRTRLLARWPSRPRRV